MEKEEWRKEGGVEEGRQASQPAQPILPASEDLRQISVLSERSGGGEGGVGSQEF